MRPPDILYNGIHDIVSVTAPDWGKAWPPLTTAPGSEDEDDGYVTSSQM